MRTAKTNQGSECLFTKDEWVDASELHGTDQTVLTHPLMEEAFTRICSSHTKRNDTAVLALCTATRPYSSTPLWRGIRDTVAGKADLVVTSNGGVVPIEFEEAYPFMTYDAPGSKEFDSQYISVLSSRLTTFLSIFKYKKIVAFFRPGRRNLRAVSIACNTTRTSYVCVPSQTLWDILNLRMEGKSGVGTVLSVTGHWSMPMSHASILQALAKEVGVQDED